MNDKKELLSASYGQTAVEYTQKTDGIILNDLIDTFCDLVPQGHILDIGCAQGRDMAIFENKGYQVSGLEITPELVAIARSRVKGDILLEDIVDEDISVNNVNINSLSGYEGGGIILEEGINGSSPLERISLNNINTKC